MLVDLNKGDKCSNFEITNEKIKEYLDSRHLYQGKADVPLDVALEDISQLYGGVVFGLVGQSGSGKSTFCKELTSYLSENGIKYIVLERDYLAAEVVQKKLAEEKDNGKSLLLKLTVGKKGVDKLIQKWKKEGISITEEEIDEILTRSQESVEVFLHGIGYKIMYTIFKHKTFKLGMIVDKSMKEQSKNAIKNKCVVIYDTVKYGTNATSSVTPYSIGECLRVNFLFNGFEKENKECAMRRGMTPQKFNKTFRGKKGGLSIFNTKACEMVYEKGRTSIQELFNPEIPNFTVAVIKGEENKLAHSFASQFPALITKIIKNKSVAPQFDRKTFKLNDDMALANLIEHLLERLGSIEIVQQWLRSQGYILKVANIAEDKDNPKVPIYCISYVEGSTRTDTPWYHAMRGAVFVLREGKVIMLKSALDRAAEIGTPAVNQAKIETQENGRKLGWGQEHIQKALSDEDMCKELKFILSGKRDGSMCVLSVYKKDTEQYKIINEMFQSNTLDVSTWAYKLWTINKEYGIVMSSKSTFVAGPQMSGFYLAAIAMAHLGYKPNQLNGKTSDEMVDICTSWFHDNLLAYTTNQEFEQVSYCFEAVCSGRTDPTNGYEHKELACSYKKSYFSLLVQRVMLEEGSLGIAQPHWEIQNEIQGFFEDPLFWKILASQIDLIMAGIRDGTVSIKPSNLRIGDDWSDEEVDPEGFIGYAPIELSNGEIIWIPNKLKEAFFYIGHKLEKYFDKSVSNKTLTQMGIMVSNENTRNYKWSEVIFKFISEETLNRYPLVQRVVLVKDTTEKLIPSLVNKIREEEYVEWLMGKIPSGKTNPEIPILDKKTHKVKKIITMQVDSTELNHRNPNIYRGPFVPLYLQEESTKLWIGKKINELSDGKIGMTMSYDVKNALLRNKSWIITGKIDLTKFEWKNGLLEIAKEHCINTIDE